MNFFQLKSFFSDLGCQKIYVKVLAANDNSKNQVYLGGSFDILNILPITEIKNEAAGDWNKERFKAKIPFFWITDDGNIHIAPDTQLILYPKYPEVRLSGFLQGCETPPSVLMTQRTSGRLLFFSTTNDGKAVAYVTAPDSDLSKEFSIEQNLYKYGVFSVVELPSIIGSKRTLLAELCRIHSLGWIDSKRLDARGYALPCNAPQCGGYTLEAELGVKPNGYAKPDYLGWEIKQFGVSKFSNTGSSTITLMTPEPTGGFYATNRVEKFLRKYGYPDRTGREDRINFGGIHKIGHKHPLTGLQLMLTGFDEATGKIRSTDGKIMLLDGEYEVASWGFASLLQHWNTKHHQTCYVPSLSRVMESKQYMYGGNVTLGIGTDFQLFLSEMQKGNIYYDPGIKLEKASSANPDIKSRNQFRIKFRHIPNIYIQSEEVEVCIK